jgi:hypothetical protein
MFLSEISMPVKIFGMPIKTSFYKNFFNACEFLQRTFCRCPFATIGVIFLICILPEAFFIGIEFDFKNANFFFLHH